MLGRRCLVRAGGVGPARVEGVGERQVAHAQAEEGAERLEAVLDDVSALHAHQARDPSLGGDAPHVGGGERQGEVLRVSSHQLVHGVDADDRFANRAPASLGPAHVDREELGIESALAHARQILVTLVVALVEVPVRILEPRSRVRVTVDDDGVTVQCDGGIARVTAVTRVARFILGVQAAVGAGERQHGRPHGPVSRHG